MATVSDQRVLRMLVEHFNAVRSTMRSLHNAAMVLPTEGLEVFAFAEGDAANIRVTVRPVVFWVPERQSHVSSSLYVAVSGALAFDRVEFVTTGILATREFTSQVAYFRVRPNGLEHVYGAHYDFAVDQLGHPAFHAQVGTFAAELVPAVIRRYRTQGLGDDRVSPLLRSVRLPSAQMDVFAICIQICADHLLGANSGPAERRAFNGLLDRRWFRGAGGRIARLASAEALNCYGSRHWYPRVV